MTTEPQFLKPDPEIEASVRSTGEALFRSMDAHPAPGILSKKGAYARIMEWSMKDPVFKTQLFRFVDVLPSLTSSADIVRHLQEYLGDKAVELNPALKAASPPPPSPRRSSRARSRRRSWTWRASSSRARTPRT